jgi:3-phenylpropionate/cinnamic acid dioxygenase small subunit
MTQTTSAAIDAATDLAVRQFLYREARYADQGAYAEWLDLWAAGEVRYWVTPRADLDPTREVSLVYDDRALLEQRVSRWLSGFAWAQVPRSVTSRAVSNVEVFQGDGGTLSVEANAHVWISRKRVTSFLAERVSYELVPSGRSYLITKKTVVLVDGESPVGNVSFVL